MAKEVMSRKASDNIYLHKDFHAALSLGIKYLYSQFGENAVREYLHQYTISFCSPLIENIKQKGLIALKEHYEKIYALEGTVPEFALSENELTMRIDASPAVSHINKMNIPVADLFHETIKTVNESLCEGTPFATELLEYDKKTGACIQRFYRRTDI